MHVCAPNVKSVLCNVSLGKGDCPESFHFVGDKHTNLHQFSAAFCYIRPFFLSSTHHKAERRSRFSFLSVSLTGAFCSQRLYAAHTRGYTHSKDRTHISTGSSTLLQTSTPCVDEASPSPHEKQPHCRPTGTAQLPPNTNPQPVLL